MVVEHGNLSGVKGGPVDPQKALGMSVQAEIERARIIERSYAAIGRGMAEGAQGLVSPWVQKQRDERLGRQRMEEIGATTAARAQAAEQEAQSKAMGVRAGSLASLYLATSGTPGLQSAKISPHRAMFPLNSQEDTVNLYAGDRDPTGEQGLRPSIEKAVKGLARQEERFWFDQREVPGLVQQIALKITGAKTLDEISPQAMMAIEQGVQDRIGDFPTTIEEAAAPLLKQAQGQLSLMFGTAQPAMQQQQQVPYGPVGGTPGALEPLAVTEDTADKLDWDAMFPGGIPGATYGSVARKVMLSPDPQTGAPNIFDPRTGTFSNDDRFSRWIEREMRADSPMGLDLREAFMLGPAQPGWVTSKAELKKIGQRPEAQGVLARPVPPLKPGEPSGFLRGGRREKAEPAPAPERQEPGPSSLKGYIKRAREGG